LRAGAPKSDGASGQAALAWKSLAAMDGGPSLLAARDRAVLALLASPDTTGASPQGPVALFLRDRLEEAMAIEDWARCERVLAADRAIEVFSATEQAQWQSCVTVFATIGAEPAAQHPIETRAAYLGILRQAPSASAARMAARRIKALLKEP
jgi:hypothetical protein